MQAGVIVFPGSNCDRDVAICLEAAFGQKPKMIWHGDSELPPLDVIVIPGGFSYGDYLRCGAMAAHSKIMQEVIKAAKKGVLLLGICNGFQILIECGLLPGILMRNQNMHFICKDAKLMVENSTTPFTHSYKQGQHISLPIAHNEGNYFADDETLKELEGDGQIVFRYQKDENPNGS
ncbi:MAG: phosphoribosylformylglycinamidine synthase subunit PurQ, partial [Parvibaculales bacterium]